MELTHEDFLLLAAEELKLHTERLAAQAKIVRDNLDELKRLESELIEAGIIKPR